MQVVIHKNAEPPYQEIRKEWYGRTIEPSYHYRFSLSERGLLFEARRMAKPSVHPHAIPGCFQKELWRYDVAEFFIAKGDLSRYVEVNLSPNGAWWASAFTAPRVVDEQVSALLRVEYATGEATDDGWQASLLLPQSVLDALGLHLPDCRVAACAVLEAPDYIYLTTANPCDTQPDFHRPDLWSLPQMR